MLALFKVASCSSWNPIQLENDSGTFRQGTQMENSAPLPADITDDVHRIADALTGFDVGSLVETIVGTLVGALLAGVVAFLVLRQERSERYETKITDAARDVMVQIAEYAKEVRNFRGRLIDHHAAEANGTTTTRPLEPERTDLDVSLDILIARSKARDRIVAEGIREVAYELTFVMDMDWSSREYHALRRVISAWRSARRSNDETIASLLVINDRRRRTEAGAKADDLPAAPEPFERKLSS